jgi:hypothetical protein
MFDNDSVKAEYCFASDIQLRADNPEIKAQSVNAKLQKPVHSAKM